SGKCQAGVECVSIGAVNYPLVITVSTCQTVDAIATRHCNFNSISRQDYEAICSASAHEGFNAVEGDRCVKRALGTRVQMPGVRTIRGGEAVGSLTAEEREMGITDCVQGESVSTATALQLINTIEGNCIVESARPIITQKPGVGTIGSEQLVVTVAAGKSDSE